MSLYRISHRIFPLRVDHVGDQLKPCAVNHFMRYAILGKVLYLDDLRQACGENIDIDTRDTEVWSISQQILWASRKSFDILTRLLQKDLLVVIHSSACCEGSFLSTEHRPIGAFGPSSMHRLMLYSMQGYNKLMLRRRKSGTHLDMTHKNNREATYIMEPWPGSLTTTALASFSFVISGSIFR